MTWDVNIQRDGMRGVLEFWFVDRERSEIIYVLGSEIPGHNTVFKTVQFDPSSAVVEPRNPSLELPMAVGQKMLDALWMEGYRPNQYNETGENAALRKSSDFLQRNLEKFIDRATAATPAPLEFHPTDGTP